MATKNSKPKSKQVAKKIVIEKDTVIPAKEAEKLTDKEVITITANPNDIIIEEQPVIEAEPIVEKTICRVLVAAPTYYVINKNGQAITIHEKNNYRRGDEILK